MPRLNKQFKCLTAYLGSAEKAFRWWQGVAPPTPPTSGGAGGVWGFSDFQVGKYLIFREKVQEFAPRSPQWLALFEG
ncbi:hypothetical protein, partial [Microcystis sp. M112S2]|uniref:hypothetical protein n=1 Tax=Microcystis sp. M112S2 TaxID=2771138 RepID=UPI00258C1F2D